MSKQQSTKTPKQLEAELFAAVKSGNFKEVKRLVEKEKVSVNCQDEEGMTPAMHATNNINKKPQNAADYANIGRYFVFRDDLENLTDNYGNTTEDYTRNQMQSLLGASFVKLYTKENPKEGSLEWNRQRQSTTSSQAAASSSSASVASSSATAASPSTAALEYREYNMPKEVSKQYLLTLLMDGAKKGNLEQIKQVLSQDEFLLDAQDENGDTALIHAVRNIQTSGANFVEIYKNKKGQHYVDVIEFLVRNGANYLLRNNQGESALQTEFKVPKKYYQQILAETIREVKYPDKQDKRRLSLVYIVLAETTSTNQEKEELFNAISQGRLVKVKEIIIKKPHMIEAVNKDGETPLIIVNRLMRERRQLSGDLKEISDFLMSKNPDGQREDHYGNTMMTHLTLFRQELTAARSGISAIGSFVNAMHQGEEKTVLYTAKNPKPRAPINFGEGFIKYTVASSSSSVSSSATAANSASSSSATAASAARAGQVEPRSDDLKAKDQELYHVAGDRIKNESERKAKIETLVEEGAEVNAQHRKGRTALMQAVENGFVGTARLLIDLGADARIKNIAGETALDIAKGKKDNQEMIKLLEEGVKKMENAEKAQRDAAAAQSSSAVSANPNTQVPSTETRTRRYQAFNTSEFSQDQIDEMATNMASMLFSGAGRGAGGNRGRGGSGGASQ